MKVAKPLAKNENLSCLCKDHHKGLLLGWKLRQGIENGTPLKDMTSYIHFLWSHCLEPHFKDEEKLLFPVLNNNDGKRRLAETQHTYIRKLIGIILDDRTLLCEALLVELGDELERHIRFEEKILFPYIEERVSPEELDHIGWELEESHAVTYQDDWHHEFWKTPA